VRKLRNIKLATAILTIFRLPHPNGPHVSDCGTFCHFHLLTHYHLTQNSLCSPDRNDARIYYHNPQRNVHNHRRNNPMISDSYPIPNGHIHPNNNTDNHHSLRSYRFTRGRLLSSARCYPHLRRSFDSRTFLRNRLPFKSNAASPLRRSLISCFLFDICVLAISLLFTIQSVRLEYKDTPAGNI
jgi:hypothetical protein